MTRWATVEVHRCYTDHENPQPGEFYFTWTAQLYRAGSKKSVVAKMKSKHTYESVENAKKGAKELLEFCGYKIKKG